MSALRYLGLAVLLAALPVLLIACGDGGSSGSGGGIFTTSSSDTTPPGNVQNLEVEDGDAFLVVSWDTPTDDDIATFVIYYSTDADPDDLDEYSVGPDIDVDDVTEVDTDGEPLTIERNSAEVALPSGTYHIRVQVVDTSSNASDLETTEFGTGSIFAAELATSINIFPQGGIYRDNSNAIKMTVGFNFEGTFDTLIYSTDGSTPFVDGALNPAAGTTVINNPTAATTIDLTESVILKFQGTSDGEPSPIITHRYEFIEQPVDTFEKFTGMNLARERHKATRLSFSGDGDRAETVIVTGGYDPNAPIGSDPNVGRGSIENSAEIFTTTFDHFEPLEAQLNQARMEHLQVQLNRDAGVHSAGDLLLIGGRQNFRTDMALDSIEYYDQINQVFTQVGGAMDSRRLLGGASVLLNGDVLITGGFDGDPASRLGPPTAVFGVGQTTGNAVVSGTATPTAETATTSRYTDSAGQDFSGVQVGGFLLLASGTAATVVDENTGLLYTSDDGSATIFIDPNHDFDDSNIAAGSFVRVRTTAFDPDSVANDQEVLGTNAVDGSIELEADVTLGLYASGDDGDIVSIGGGQSSFNAPTGVFDDADDPVTDTMVLVIIGPDGGLPQIGGGGERFYEIDTVVDGQNLIVDGSVDANVVALDYEIRERVSYTITQTTFEVTGDTDDTGDLSAIIVGTPFVRVNTTDGLVTYNLVYQTVDEFTHTGNDTTSQLLGGDGETWADAQIGDMVLRKNGERAFITAVIPNEGDTPASLSILGLNTQLLEGETFYILRGPTKTAEIYDPDVDTLTTSFDEMLVPRVGHTSTLLDDGTVLLIGGFNNRSSDDNRDRALELYDPVTDSFLAVVPFATSALDDPVYYGAATKLRDGSVLFCGGADRQENELDPANGDAFAEPSLSDSIYLFDPVSWTTRLASVALNENRTRHEVITMSDGRVLIVGGYIDYSDEGTPIQTNTADVYDPVTETLTTITMNEFRALTQLINLDNGQTMVAGGAVRPISGTLDVTDFRDVDVAEATVELGSDYVENFVTSTNEFVPNAHGMKIERMFGAEGILLPDGRYLICGGQAEIQGGDIGPFSDVMEVFDPATLTFETLDATLSEGRRFHSVDLVFDAELDRYVVLIAGGETSPGVPTDSFDVFDPEDEEIVATGTLQTARASHTTTRLSNGRLFFAGGGNSAAQALKTTEIYDPSDRSSTSGPSMAAGRTGHTAHIMPTGHVMLIGGRNELDRSLDIYDPFTGTFLADATVGDMNQGRKGHRSTHVQYFKGFARFTFGSATVLGRDTAWQADGVVQVGDFIYNNDTLEIYEITAINSDTDLTVQKLDFDDEGDKVNGTTYEEDSSTGFVDYTIFNRDVVIFGGARQVDANLASSELIDIDPADPTNLAFVSTIPDLALGRDGHSLMNLPDGRLIIAGGTTVDDTVDGSATTWRTFELYTPNFGVDPMAPGAIISPPQPPAPYTAAPFNGTDGVVVPGAVAGTTTFTADTGTFQTFNLQPGGKVEFPGATPTVGGFVRDEFTILSVDSDTQLTLDGEVDDASISGTNDGAFGLNTATFTSATSTFQTDGVAAGDVVVFNDGVGNLPTVGGTETDRFTVLSVDSENQLTVTATVDGGTIAGLDFDVVSPLNWEARSGLFDANQQLKWQVSARLGNNAVLLIRGHSAQIFFPE